MTALTKAPSELAPAAGAPASAALIGQPIPRLEDAAILTGQARYTDDLPVKPGTLHAAILRSPHAHAEILGIDVSGGSRNEGRCRRRDGRGREALRRPFPGRRPRADGTLVPGGGSRPLCRRARGRRAGRRPLSGRRRARPDRSPLPPAAGRHVDRSGAVGRRRTASPRRRLQHRQHAPLQLRRRERGFRDRRAQDLAPPSIIPATPAPRWSASWSWPTTIGRTGLTRSCPTSPGLSPSIPSWRRRSRCRARSSGSSCRPTRAEASATSRRYSPTSSSWASAPGSPAVPSNGSRTGWST